MPSVPLKNNKMKKIILNNITGKKVLLLFILTNLVYSFMLIFTIPKVMSFSDGKKILDMLPTGYNAEYVNSLFETLGEKGRDAYLFNQIPVDMVYPFLFGISSCLVLAFFLNKINKLNGTLIYLCLLPVFGGAFDYMENIGIITMLANYPDISNLSVSITNIFSILKSTFTTVYFIVLIITFVAVVIRFFKQKKKQVPMKNKAH